MLMRAHIHVHSCCNNYRDKNLTIISERAKRASSVTVHAPLKFKIYIFVVQAYVGFRILYVRPFYGPNYGGKGQSTGKTR